MEFKWYITIDISEEEYEAAEKHFDAATQAFFDSLNSSVNSNGEELEFEVLGEEIK